jgi:uncharacterized protein (TIGR03083 family)
MTKPIDILTDTVVHAQDIRRSLGKPREIPEPCLRAVLDHGVTISFPIGNKKRIAGLTLLATDIDWRHGDGSEVKGTGEALMMVMYGRAAALDDLAGEGTATLRGRF